jgi:hypothetical protein
MRSLALRLALLAVVLLAGPRLALADIAPGPPPRPVPAPTPQPDPPRPTPPGGGGCAQRAGAMPLPQALGLAVFLGASVLLLRRRVR